MKVNWRGLGLGLALLLSVPGGADAAVVTGQAPIETSVEVARAEARKDAMRQVIEQAVGVHISSSTKTSLGMVVEDEILAKADGYVTVNKILREWQANGCFLVEMDATASDQKIQTTIEDLRGRLQAIQDMDTSRSGVSVAVVERTADGRYVFTTDETVNYIEAKLNLAGYQAKPNETMTAWLLKHAGDPDAGLQARRVARDNREEENAVLRGLLAVEGVRSLGGGMKEATVKASFEMIGLDSNSADAYVHRAKAVAANEQDAIEKARDDATRKALEEIGKQSVTTVQSETFGGAKQIKVNIEFQNMADFAAQSQTIQNALAAVKCRVIRTARVSPTTLRVFVSTDAYSGLGELAGALKAAIPGLTEGVPDQNALGSTKIYLTF